MIKPIHPFPARMGPDLAIDRLKQLRGSSVVLDPMAGSGTVLRHAAEFGHVALGRDLDPLAVLMARVWTTPVEDAAIERQFNKLLAFADKTDPESPLPWIDDDPDTRAFVEYWFAKPQRNDLRRLAGGLHSLDKRRSADRHRAALDVLRLALSRIIITKESGASLARDVSHSRPHRVTDATDYKVISGFKLSVQRLRDRLSSQPPPGRVTVSLGDARTMTDVENGSVDAVLSSPPYLNAIDYMRGHRLSLVWLGYRLAELRTIRSRSIGSERGPERLHFKGEFGPIIETLGDIGRLPRCDQKMIDRYAEDTYRLMSEIARVLRNDGRAVLVVGNSCLRNVFISNADGFIAAGRMVGLRVTRKIDRDLPTRKRYLPIPKRRQGPLGKRMRTETVLTFRHA